MGYWILAPWPGIELAPLALKTWSRNHWTVMQIPKTFLISCDSKTIPKSQTLQPSVASLSPLLGAEMVNDCRELFLKSSPLSRTSLVAETVKNLPAMQETWVWSLGREDPLKKRMATHFSILAWEMLWTEEPGGLQSIRSWKSQTWPSDYATGSTQAYVLFHFSLHHNEL